MPRIVGRKSAAPSTAFRATPPAGIGHRKDGGRRYAFPPYGFVVGALLMFCPAGADAASPDGKAIFLHGNQNGALPCAACHGVNALGNGSIGAPQLAGLPAPAIESILAQFAKGDGGNAIMQSIAQSLSPAETEAVATYLSTLPK